MAVYAQTIAHHSACSANVLALGIVVEGPVSISCPLSGKRRLRMSGHRCTWRGLSWLIRRSAQIRPAGRTILREETQPPFPQNGVHSRYRPLCLR